MEIHTERNVVPQRAKPSRRSIADNELIAENIKEMLENKIIQKSVSPWGSRIVLVEKKGGKRRLCVDYRDLNKYTQTYSYPLPRIDDCLDRLSGAKLYSSLDLFSGYHQIPLKQSDKYKTAFFSSDGSFEYNRVPFGMKNAPSQFQMIMNEVLSKFITKGVLIYIDDIIIYARSIAEHNRILTQVLEKLREHNFKLNTKKCFFNQLEIGHVISEHGRSPTQKKDK